jgi:glutaredoxin
VTNDLRGEARKVIDKMKSRTGVELTEDEVIAAPNIFIGSIDRFVEKFEELRERLGISSFMVGEIDELAPVVERLAGT